jgi:hypothetical protein
VPRRSRESLQILEELREVAAKKAEASREHAYAGHLSNYRQRLEEEADAGQERLKAQQESIAAFEWRILL